MAEFNAKSGKQYLLHACIFVYVKNVNLGGDKAIFALI